MEPEEVDIVSFNCWAILYQQGVCHTVIYIKKYLKAKEEE
jgi:hypothetical protein